MKVRSADIYFIKHTAEFGQTHCGNGSNLHTKRAFTHDIFQWNHKVSTVVSLSAIQWTTHSVFSVLAWQKVEIWRPKQWIWMRDAAKLPTLLSSPLGRDWERGQLSPYRWRARNVWPYKLCLAAAHVCRSANSRKKGQPREVNRNSRNEFPENVCSIRFWTGISGNFGRMERAPFFREFGNSGNFLFHLAFLPGMNRAQFLLSWKATRWRRVFRGTQQWMQNDRT